MERARRNKQNVVGRSHPILRVDRRPFHNRQNVPLHALAGHVRPMPALAPGNLVDLVQENNAESSTRSTASRVTWSMSISRRSSSCTRYSNASATFIFRFFVRCPNSPGNMSLMLMSMSSVPLRG